MPRTKKKKSRKRKSRRNCKRGGNVNKCCMCKKLVDIKSCLMPRRCSVEHGLRAHRICQDCWFDEDHGFAREGVSHECPGCIEGMPLTKYEFPPPEMVDLTE